MQLPHDACECIYANIEFTYPVHSTVYYDLDLPGIYNYILYKRASQYTQLYYQVNDLKFL